MPTTQDKEQSLLTAIEIIKEYARGGGNDPSSALRPVYATLNELKDDVKKEN